MSGAILQEKAKVLAEMLNLPHKFRETEGWVERFKKRNGISAYQVCGESLSCSNDKFIQFRCHLKEVIQEKGLTSAQIYNMDETGLY